MKALKRYVRTGARLPAGGHIPLLPGLRMTRRRANAFRTGPGAGVEFPFPGNSLIDNADITRYDLSMKILVTGASGFLGTNVVLECLRRGHTVRAFSLPGSGISFIQKEGVELAFGDVADPEAVAPAVKGVDAVIHVAGDTSFWKKRFARQRRTNVEGVRTVMEAALREGVGRVVHTSTVDALGYNPDGLADENWPKYNYEGLAYNYADTKREGERLALSFAPRGLAVTVINPGSMIGPFDHTLQFGRLFLDLRDGRVPAVLPGGAPWAHVTEVARAHVEALSAGRPGERYICGGINETYRNVFGAICASVGARPPRFTMGPRATVAYGYLMEFLSNFTNRPPELNPGQARYMSVFPRYDSSKAARELGFRAVSVENMVGDAARWYRENGFL